MNELQLAEVTIALILLLQLLVAPITFKQINHAAEAQLEVGRMASEITTGRIVAESNSPYCTEVSEAELNSAGEKCVGFENSASETAFVFNGFQFEPVRVSAWYNDS